MRRTTSGALHGSRFRRLLATAALGATLALPSAVAAQLCAGSPAGPGQFALQAGLTFMDGGTGFGGSGTANLDGPLSLNAGAAVVDIDGLDSNLKSLSGGVAYDLPIEGFAACPFAGAGYDTWSGSFEGVSTDLSVLSLPLGLSVGVSVGDGESAILIPSASAGLLYQRGSVSASDGFDQVDESDSDTEFFVGGGAAVAFGQLFLRVGISTTTADGSSSVISAGVGVVF